MSAAERTRTGVAAPEGSQRLLSGIRRDGQALSLEEHLHRWGAAPAVRGSRGRRAFREAVAASGLTGRGGAGFPLARKLEAVAAGRGPAVVVANGTEGEPPSGKDKVLLAYAPHLVLDGAVLAARAVGAGEVVVAAGATCRTQVAAALTERRWAGMDADLTMRAVTVPDGFVTGEETALVAFLDGGPALPSFAPPRPFERGVGGAPTLVQNVETLAHLALVARFGPGWFRSVGTADEPGSALVTLSGAVRDPGVYEVALGSTLEQLLARAGGATAELGALLVGGYFGTWVPAAEALAAPLSVAGLAPVRRRPGGARPGRAALLLVRAARDGAGRPLARRRERGPVRAVRPRARRDRLRPRRAGPCRRQGVGAGVAAAAARPRRRPRRVPSPRRRRPLRRERAARLRGRGRPARAPRPLLGPRRARGAAAARALAAGGPVSRRLRVNPIACDAHGLCAELLPELIELDEWGYPVVSGEPVPRPLQKHARRAVAACPALALLLEERPDSPAPSPQGIGRAPDRGGRGQRGRSTEGGSMHPQKITRR